MPSHPRTKCPHCESTLRRIRTQTHTKLIKEIVMSCPNEECQCVFVAIEEIEVGEEITVEYIGLKEEDYELWF